MNLAIEAVGLTKRYGKAEVLSHLDLAVPRGTIFALLGPNGAGKTTTINILTTLERADAGTARVDGVDVGSEPKQVRSRIAVTGQSAAVDGVLSGEENLRMMGRLLGLGSREARVRAGQLLESLELSPAARRPVKSYSGGMRRRLDLAISLIVTRPVLFLDEPTTGLDTRSRQQLWGVIRSLAANGSTVFLTTQYLEEADVLADDIAVLNGGRVVASGTAAQLKARIGGESVELHDELGALLFSVPSDGSVPGVRAAIDEIDRLGLRGVISLRRPSLDDVFLALTGPDPAGAPPTPTTPVSSQARRAPADTLTGKALR